jgi:alkanesulfonate monooxygenase SsuD/methylene tetrahydromethanopterin reductase-like flavin-dependent oxidoreductase (luciferase family)
MEFGLFSQHHRPGRAVGDAYEEDAFEIVTADQLGYREAWISEHAFPAELLICKLAGCTEAIRLGPGVRPLAIHHPLQVASEANACDQLTRGRYQFGFGLGGPLGGPRKMEQRGLGNDGQRRARMWEAVRLIRKAWTSPEPFDFDGSFWRGTGIRLEPPSFQLPHPPMAISTSGSRDTLQTAGREGYWPLLGANDDSRSVREMLDVYSAAAPPERPAPRAAARLARLVYVGESLDQALGDLRPTLGRQVQRERELLRELLERSEGADEAHRDPALRAGIRILEALGSDRVEAITLEALVECGYYLVGEPDAVTLGVERLFRESGGFGTLLLLVGREVGTRDGRARSLRLFMEHCVPRLRHLDVATGVERGVAGDRLQAERGRQLLRAEPGAARQRRPGSAVEGRSRP